MPLESQSLDQLSPPGLSAVAGEPEALERAL
jgi:hypothetical protein